jgi:hypothetical protein
MPATITLLLLQQKVKYTLGAVVNLVDWDMQILKDSHNQGS